MLFVAPEVALQLDVRAPFEDAADLVHCLFGIRTCAHRVILSRRGQGGKNPRGVEDLRAARFGVWQLAAAFSTRDDDRVISRRCSIFGLEIVQRSPRDAWIRFGDPSRNSGRSFKDLREIIQGTPRDRSRISEKSFQDLWRCLYFGLKIIQGSLRDRSRISERSFQDLREIIQGSLEMLVFRSGDGCIAIGGQFNDLEEIMSLGLRIVQRPPGGHESRFEDRSMISGRS